MAVEMRYDGVTGERTWSMTKRLEDNSTKRTTDIFNLAVHRRRATDTYLDVKIPCAATAPYFITRVEFNVVPRIETNFFTRLDFRARALEHTRMCPSSFLHIDRHHIDAEGVGTLARHEPF